jgi:hypothetical protein
VSSLFPSKHACGHDLIAILIQDALKIFEIPEYLIISKNFCINVIIDVEAKGTNFPALLVSHLMHHGVLNLFGAARISSLIQEGSVHPCSTEAGSLPTEGGSISLLPEGISSHVIELNHLLGSIE